MKNTFKWICIVVGSVLIILILTKPTIKDFKEYVGNENCKDFQLFFSKKKDYLVFAEYEFYYEGDFDAECVSKERIHIVNEMTGKHYGFFLNFYKK